GMKSARSDIIYFRLIKVVMLPEKIDSLAQSRIEIEARLPTSGRTQLGSIANQALHLALRRPHPRFVAPKLYFHAHQLRNFQSEHSHRNLRAHSYIHHLAHQRGGAQHSKKSRSRIFHERKIPGGAEVPQADLFFSRKDLGDHGGNHRASALARPESI